MFIRPASSELINIARGLLVLLLIIIAGVVAAESQINSLTQRQDCVQVLNMKRDFPGGYTAYFFGQVYHIQAVYPVAKILNQDHDMIITAGNYQIVIPTKMDLDAGQARQRFTLWVKPITGEAFQCKYSLQRYIAELSAKMADYIR
ncbi:MAG: hypothetical protein ABFC84_11205 [Veillonellales bacterium]